jgi:hypothetical protein
VAIHLLNRAYDGAKDAMVAQRGLTLRLRADLFGGRTFSKATLHTPKAQPAALALSSDRATTTVKVPELELWAIIELGDWEM